MYRITAVVMAHPKRRRQALHLYDQLIKYPFSEVRIVWDELNDEWHTGERSLRAGIILGGDWHVVIQDDAILTPEFFTNLQGAIANLPTRALVSLYVGRVKPLSSNVEIAINSAAGASWLRHDMLLWGVGMLIPTDHIEPMLDFVNEPKYQYTQYDTRIGMFYQRNRLSVYYTNPSLVNHDDALGSLIDGHRTAEPRIAHSLATGVLEWNSRVVDI